MKKSDKKKIFPKFQSKEFADAEDKGPVFTSLSTA